MTQPDTITIRPLHVDEWVLFRDLRLHALKTCPQVFSSNYTRESNFTEQDWKDWLENNETQCTFGLFDDHRLIGITSIYAPKSDPTGQSAQLGASFIHEDYRGRKLSRLLYQARLDFAKKQGDWKKVIVSHRIGNEASRRANQAAGFHFTHATPHLWPDGVTEDELIYEILTAEI